MEWWVPVGVQVGAFPDEESGPWSYEIQLGEKIEALSDVEFVIWRYAGRPDEDEPTPDIAAIRADLAERGLLAIVAEPTRFALAHRLTPLLLGLGPTLIGLPGRVLATVAEETYEVWARSPEFPTLHATCANVSPDALSAVLADLPVLLTTAAAAVEVAR